MTRQVRTRRRRHSRGPRCRPRRTIVRTRHYALAYRGRIAALIGLLVLLATTLTVGAVAGHVGLGALAAGIVLAGWLGYAVRVARPVPFPGGNGPAPPGGASMREPRRPLPVSPAGAAARPRCYRDDPPRQVAVVA